MVAVRWRERWRSVPNLSLAVPNPKVVLRALVPNQKSRILKLGPQMVECTKVGIASYARIKRQFRVVQSRGTHAVAGRVATEMAL